MTRKLIIEVNGKKVYLKESTKAEDLVYVDVAVFDDDQIRATAEMSMAIPPPPKEPKEHKPNLERVKRKLAEDRERIKKANEDRRSWLEKVRKEAKQ